MRWLIGVAMLAAAVPLKDCGTVKVDGPKTAQCPEGRYVVTYDQTQDPPVVSYACEKPAPSASPVPSPSAIPSASPSAAPSATPPPTPSSPSPSPAPTPSAPPSSPTPAPSSSASACPKPDDLKIGFRAAVPKERGFRNTFDLTPTFQGKAEDVSCGDYLVETYGEFQRFVSGDHIAGRDPVELQSDNLYILVDATNSDDNPDHWSGKTYLVGGRRTYCVSYAHLSHWRCQDGTMDDSGRLVGFGQNARGYDLQK